MRSNRTSSTGGAHHHNHHHPRRRLFIRNFLTDFRRQSSVNDYKLPNTLVCTFTRPRSFSLVQETFAHESDLDH